MEYFVASEWIDGFSIHQAAVSPSSYGFPSGSVNSLSMQPVIMTFAAQGTKMILNTLAVRRGCPAPRPRF